MCGRTACALDKHNIQRATRQYSPQKDTDLKWVQNYSWQNYQPSYNLCPTQISPVILNGQSLKSEGEHEFSTVLMPMRWGLVPSWYKGALSSFGLIANNCRIEGLTEKPTFRGAINSNRRCVILADGFYEWKVVSGGKKQPYFIYFPQKEEAFLEGSQRLLTMAGIFDVWKSAEEDPMYSYSVITMPASKSASFVHSRMPAILDGEEKVSAWLDTDKINTREALSMLKPIEELQMHPVSTIVNKWENNVIDCIKRENKKELKVNTLTSWLKKSAEPATKRFKTDS